MQDPKREIAEILPELTSATSAPALEHTINTYFTPDARFLHPLCQTTSRAGILGIYEWYRIMSPHTKTEVLSVVYDEEINVLIVEIVQMFRIWFSIFPSAPSRLNTRLTLREINGRHYIAQQEDFYHPTDIMALLIAPLVPILRLILAFAGWISGLNALMFTLLGLTGGKYAGASASLQAGRIFGGMGGIDVAYGETNQTAKLFLQRQKFESTGSGGESPKPDGYINTK